MSELPAPTPETDKLFLPLWLKDSPPTDEELHKINKRFRKLELERDEARRMAEHQRDSFLRLAKAHPKSILFPWEIPQNNEI